LLSELFGQRQESTGQLLDVWLRVDDRADGDLSLVG
jgi:hypothetical protein